jgi:hypothetical protein
MRAHKRAAREHAHLRAANMYDAGARSAPSPLKSFAAV